MNQSDLFAVSSRRERDLALKKVADNSDDWMGKALSAMRFLSVRREWTGEDIRLTVEAVVGRPHHHNAWGALINQAVRTGLIVRTGKHAPMRELKSHARQTPVYRVTGSGLRPGADHQASES